MRRVLCLILALCTTPLRADWFHDDWQNRVKITIPAANVAGSSSLTMPLAILPADNADIAAGARPDGRDLVFTASDGTTQLPHVLLPEKQFASRNGIWTWFSDPRAVYHNGTNERLFVGVQAATISGQGNAIQYVVQYDYGTGTLTRTQVGDVSEFDDHNNPTILVRAVDSKLICFFSNHADGSIRYRISTNAEDATAWGSVQTLDPDGGANTYSYTHPVELTNEDKIYLFYRETGTEWRYITSTDDGATWGSSTAINTTTGFGASPYMICTTNGSRVDFMYSQGSPNENDSQKILHLYYDGADSTWKGSTGSSLGAPPFDLADMTEVYAAGGTDQVYPSDIKYDGSGRPHFLFYVYPSAAADNQDLYEGEFNGSTWTTRKVCDEGGGIVPGGASAVYPSVSCLDPNDDTIAWVGKEESSVYEIQKWQKTAGTWAKVDDITAGSARNHFRPIVPFGMPEGKAGYLLFCSVRTYSAFTNYTSGITAYPALGSNFKRARVRATVHGSTDTDIYCYYGNPDATDQQDAAGVYSDCMRVWLTNELWGSAPGYFAELTGGGSEQSYYKTSEGETPHSSIGPSLAFNGTSESLNLGTPNFASDTAWHVTCWAKAALNGASNVEDSLFMHSLAGTNAEIGLRLEPSGPLVEIFTTKDTNSFVGGSAGIAPANTWKCYHGQWTAAGGLKARVNQTEGSVASSTGTAMDATASPTLHFGQNSANADWLEGNAAELIIANDTSWSKDETDTRFDNYEDGNSFFTFGAEETQPAGGQPLQINIIGQKPNSEPSWSLAP